MEMEVEEIRACKKRSRIGNGSKIGFEREEEEGGEGRSRLRNWHHPSSRVIRVSRASGGKDRHSKVLTSKGLRDRRVRLSVPTAIQFYDLQDRLGYEQPSKAIEWLIKAADAAIAELPSLDTSFPTSLKLQNPIQERPSIAEGQHLSTKSGCSSNSETSKGSILSLSRPESRVKARDRGRERAKEKSRDDVHFATHHQNLNPNLNSQSSFTELLTGGTSNGAAGTNFDPQKQIRQLPSTSTADYFGQAGVFGHQQKTHQSPSGFSSQAHFGNSTSIGMVPFNIAAAAAAATDHPELQQFSFLQDHYIPVAAVAAGGDYSLNFSISSGLAGFNRGTLQSNAPSQLPHHHHHHHHHHLQRLSPPVDSTNLPLFFGAAAPTTSSAASGENQFSAGFDGRLELCYNDGYRHSDIKGKAKS